MIQTNQTPQEENLNSNIKNRSFDTLGQLRQLLKEYDDLPDTTTVRTILSCTDSADLLIMTGALSYYDEFEDEKDKSIVIHVSNPYVNSLEPYNYSPDYYSPD